MSYKVNGLEIPASCLRCPFSGTNADHVFACRAVEKAERIIRDNWEKRPDWCPLEEVKEDGEA